jgi:hypothetical protein
MLSARQERILEEIEARLRHSDGSLALRFAVFAELVADDEMPRRETLRAPLFSRRSRLGGLTGRARRAMGPQWWPTALLLLPVLILAITCTVLLAAASSHAAGCLRRGPGAVAAGGSPEMPGSYPGCGQDPRPAGGR